MITKEKIKTGLETGVVELVYDPHTLKGTVCKIGEYWFYFGGLIAEELDPPVFKEQIPVDDIISEIFDVLEDFSKQETFIDEYMYYDAYINEHCVDMYIVLLIFRFMTGDCSAPYWDVLATIRLKNVCDVDTIEDGLVSYLDSSRDDDELYEEIVDTVLENAGYEYKIVKFGIPACDAYRIIDV